MVLHRRLLLSCSRHAGGCFSSGTQLSRLGAKRNFAAGEPGARAGSGKLRIPPSEPPNASADHGWVSPADPLSNLRAIVLPVPAHETPAEKTYRVALDKVQNWNNTYWRHHNMQFMKARADFIAQRCQEMGRPESSLTAEDMASFYKDFLDTHYSQHVAYNRNWYRHNLSLVWLAFKAAASRLLVGRSSTSSGSRPKR